MKERSTRYRRYRIWNAIFVFTVFLVILGISGCNKSSAADQETNATTWDTVRKNDSPIIVSEGWNSPTRLVVSEDGIWDDSLFVNLDGKRIYFVYYPGDLITDSRANKYKTYLQVYFSDAPFVTKTKDERPYFTEQYWSPAGQSVTSNGDMFYHSNKPIVGDHGRYLQHIYKNGELLAFNNSEISYNNPQYCGGRDELWFDNGDKAIYVLKNAKASGFKGTPVQAPKPLNSYDPKINDHQPWLSEDCNTIYFSSTRDNIGSGPFIYSAQRIGEDQWSKPRLVIKSKIGVGEVTLTADMKKLFFLQVLQNSKGEFTSNLFSTERK